MPVTNRACILFLLPSNKASEADSNQTKCARHCYSLSTMSIAKENGCHWLLLYADMFAKQFMSAAQQ